MESITLAHDIYQDTVSTTQGQSFTQVADRLDQKATKLESAAEAQDNVAQTLDALRGGKREEVNYVFDEANASGEQKEVAQEIAKHLHKGAKDMRTVVSGGKNMTNEKKEGDTLADAGLGQEGSQAGDAGKMQGTETLIDVDIAKGGAAHEFEHTQQAHQTVGTVSRDAAPDEKPVSSTLDEAPKDGVVTATQLHEAGAMVVQRQEAPESESSLVTRYKETLRHVLSVVPDENRVVELARRPDGLEILQREYLMQA